MSNDKIFNRLLLAEKVRLEHYKQVAEDAQLQNVSSPLGMVIRSCFASWVSGSLLSFVPLTSYPFFTAIAVPAVFTIAMSIELKERYTEEKKRDAFKLIPDYVDSYHRLKDFTHVRDIYSEELAAYQHRIARTNYSIGTTRDAIVKMVNDDKERFYKVGYYPHAENWTYNNSSVEWDNWYTLLIKAELKA